MRKFFVLALAVACAGSLAAQGGGGQKPAGDTTHKVPPGAGALSTPNADPFPSTYKPFPSKTTVIKNATILTAVGPRIEGGSVLLKDGKIAAVGKDIAVPADAVVKIGRAHV